MYIPSDPSDPEAARIAQAFTSPRDYFQLNEQNRLPPKYGDGTVLLMSAALATSLGLAVRGLYIRYGAAWHLLG